ncbi:hypothetical protein QVD17_25364 [Tagetes erecta]|uniref:Uncharacterized protein n=1 Tax=Tagetes erecta TaxID=13708 RepID=A0AAD8NV28_TARER|nr:hypothetical protein QVD17_25364 [Tagetes erecta]
MTPETQSRVLNSGEIILFGVRVKVDPIRKSVSMNDLSQYVHVQRGTTRDSSSNSNNLDAVAGDSGYVTADDVVRNRSNRGRERKRGVAWTEDEHKLFLLGLKKVGKGDWRGISRNFVKTRTPTQVASHAQKYFLRRSNINRHRRRSSLFDITTDSVEAISMKEQQVREKINIQLNQPPMLSVPVPSSILIKNQMETVTFNNYDQFIGGPTLPVHNPMPDLSASANKYMDQKHERDSLSLCLSLNLSLSCDHNNGMDSSARHAISGFNNGDGIISVG